MDSEWKWLLWILIFFTLFTIVMLGVQTGVKIQTCRELQTLYGDVVELETGFLSATCRVGSYEINTHAIINDHLFIREYLND